MRRVVNAMTMAQMLTTFQIQSSLSCDTFFCLSPMTWLRRSASSVASLTVVGVGVGPDPEGVGVVEGPGAVVVVVDEEAVVVPEEDPAVVVVVVGIEVVGIEVVVPVGADVVVVVVTGGWTLETMLRTSVRSH
jgi:hypothetical protein